jgi:hypothetical protein
MGVKAMSQLSVISFQLLAFSARERESENQGIDESKFSSFLPFPVSEVDR